MKLQTEQNSAPAISFENREEVLSVTEEKSEKQEKRKKLKWKEIEGTSTTDVSESDAKLSTEPISSSDSSDSFRKRKRKNKNYNKEKPQKTVMSNPYTSTENSSTESSDSSESSSTTMSDSSSNSKLSQNRRNKNRKHRKSKRNKEPMKRIPISEWRLKYDGKDNGRKLAEFLKEIKMQSKSEDVTDPQSHCSIMNPVRSLLKVTALGAATFSITCLYKGNERFYENIFMPIVRLAPPETAHHLAVFGLKLGLIRPGYQDPGVLRTQLMNMVLRNPVGIAAGFDKQGEAVCGLHLLGFGFVEVGSVTPQPQPGNPGPRVFRLKEDKAIVNRYGFNSEGHKVVYERLKEARQKCGEDVALGINLGKNKLSKDAIRDYVKGVKRFSGLADYLVINISSPNTPGLRTMQNKSTLFVLLSEVLKARSSLPLAEQRPIMVKLAPDLSDEDIQEIVTVVCSKACAVDGLIVSNTTIERPSSLKSINAGQLGGLSGQPLFQRSTQLVAKVYKWTEGKIPIIGVGGIFSGRDAYNKILAGASAVQLYTAFIYHGPPIVIRVKQELEELLKADGYDSVQQAVGKGVDRILQS
ncbi:dihydroorotate dehydrogenase (quinone), mitochondrial-like [Sabethes cyaneus]|uniref:dihydroorotate dehydrogenase (quinone), mitochondrial-like n=1 Tax=Sabethes cyaneus TaxID=53552 RepID=UPI00237D468D|nr:dihydroorotate dehydrogenase (quinone), mitochondrial-like [Sabethes cyaneus]